MPRSAAFLNPTLDAEPVARIIKGATFFVIAICLAITGIVGWRIWEARKTQLVETRVQASNMARALAQHADDLVSKADAILLGLSERIQNDGSDPQALERLHRFIKSRLQANPEFQNLTLISANGMRLVSSISATPDIKLSDREYFVFHRDHPDTAAHIGAAIRSRSSNDWIITISRRLERPDGSFAGVALASIHMKYFQKFYDSFEIGGNGSITLLLDTGTLLVRRPFNEQIIGRDLTGSPIYQTYLSQGSVGSAMRVAKIDGVERLFAYQHLEKYPLIVGVALAKKDILASWQRDTYWQLAALFVLLAIFGVLGLRLIRQIRFGVQIEAQLRNAHDKLELLNLSLQQLALQDGLTGVFNRRQFDITLAAEFGRAMRTQTPLALVMLDVDCFKQYNDLYGHIAGDQCLREISAAASQALHRTTDSVARYGGEEFTVLLPDTSLQGALAVAERIRSAIENLKIPHAASPSGVVTISAGVHALIPARDVESALALIEYADLALYEAKCAGRNRVSLSGSVTVDYV